MKQAELDQFVKQRCRLEAQQRAWQVIRGTVYWQQGPLFFIFLFIARVKEQLLFCDLGFKWTALDSALWRVLDMTANEKKPLSFHANGAFKLHGQPLLTQREPFDKIDLDVLRDRISRAAAAAAQRASTVVAAITDLPSYLQYLRDEHAQYLQHHPGSPISIYREELLTAVLAKDYYSARELALARIRAGDRGGFSVNGKSFYECSLSFCEEALSGQ